MATPSRHGSVPGTYFVTSRTWQSRPVFVKDSVCKVLVETLLRYRDENAYDAHAFVLMPDHFHALMTPAEDKTLERVMQYIKCGCAHTIREELQFKFPIWQRGFSDHRIRNAEDYEIHVRYIEQNPVKKGLVGAPQDYRWSSASGRFVLDEPPQRLKPVTAAAYLRHG